MIRAKEDVTYIVPEMLLNIECGCFIQQKKGYFLLARDLLFLLPGAIIIFLFWKIPKGIMYGGP